MNQPSPPLTYQIKTSLPISQLPNTHFFPFSLKSITNYNQGDETGKTSPRQKKKKNRKQENKKKISSCPPSPPPNSSKAGISVSGRPTRPLPSTPAMSIAPLNQTVPPEDYSSPPVTIILTVILLVFFFLGFFSIYFCRCFMGNLSWLGRTPSAVNGASDSSTNRGLDPSIIESFPTFVYSTVKEYRDQKCGLECAICLSEFRDEDVVRLITVCCHVFHHDCIDLWLGSQSTCPVCRRSLDVPPGKPAEKSPANNAATATTMHDIDENESMADACSIRIEEDEDGRRKKPEEEEEEEEATCTDVRAGDLQIIRHQGDDKEGKFSRSHSTGHSVAWTKVGEDKHTLILPENVKAKIVRGHNWSCTTFGDYSGNKNRGTNNKSAGLGEVSTSINDDNV